MRGTIPKDLQNLDDFLLSDAVSENSMLLSELDGFLTGVAVCPEPILPSDWLPVVWADEEPMYESPEQADAVNGLLMAHFNSIIHQLDQNLYSPIYDVDTNDSVFWETWLEGFQAAVRLRPEAWLAFDELYKDDKAVQLGLNILVRLTELAQTDDGADPTAADRELRKAAPDLIPGCVKFLYQVQFPETRVAPVVSGPKVGRNDPCPCGSGKKYKKCCLS